MEIIIDRRARQILRYIKHHPNVTLGKLIDIFGDDADSMSMINFCLADYLVCKHPDGKLTMFKEGFPWTTYSEDTFWISPKGKKVLEDRFDRLWQWSIPVLISVAALIVSILSSITGQVPAQEPQQPAQEQHPICSCCGQSGSFVPASDS